MIVTDKGMALNAKLIGTDTALHFTRAAIGTGSGEFGIAPAEMEDLEEWFADLTGLSYKLPDPGAEKFVLEIRAEIKNQGFEEPVYITEVGAFALDPDEGEVLYGIEDFREYPKLMNPLPCGQPGFGFGESHVFDLFLEVSRDLEIEISFITDNYLSIDIANEIFARDAHRHTADQVDESVGATVEVWQRIQDNRLDTIENRIEQGISTGRTVQVGTELELMWLILKGYYDRVNKVIRA